MDLYALLGDEANSLLSHQSKAIPAQDLALPGPDFAVTLVWQSRR